MPGTELLLGVGTGLGAGGGVDNLLLEDGISIFFQEDGASVLLLE